MTDKEEMNEPEMAARSAWRESVEKGQSNDPAVSCHTAFSVLPGKAFANRIALPDAQQP